MKDEFDPLTGELLPKSNKPVAPQSPDTITAAVLTDNINDMAMLNGLTLDQERFCLAYIDTGKAKEAWVQAYGSNPARKDLNALMSNPNVIKRVTMLYNQFMSVMQQSCQVDIDMLVRELEQARQLALSEREASAAIAATMGKAKLHGLMVDRKEISMKRPEDMTEAELRQVLGREFEEDLRTGRAIEQTPTENQ